MFTAGLLLAGATSFPERMVDLKAVEMNLPDLAVGNIFGNNSINMMLSVPLDFIYPKVLFNSVKNIHAVTAYSVIAATSVAIIGKLYRKKERSRFAEPSSEIVVVAISIFLFLLYHIKSI